MLLQALYGNASQNGTIHSRHIAARLPLGTLQRGVTPRAPPHYEFSLMAVGMAAAVYPQSHGSTLAPGEAISGSTAPLVPGTGEGSSN